MSRTCVSTTGFWLLMSLPLASAARADDGEFFERKVRPALVRHCYRCHSAEAKKVRGKLRVDSLADLLKGGDTGPAIVPGKPDKSLLIEAIRYGNVDLQMPPGGKLPDSVIKDLTDWVARGATWPGSPSGEAAGYKEVRFDLQKRKLAHWSWRPVRIAPPPAVRDASWGANPIDRFLLAALEKKGLAPPAPADRATLLRRLSFDLIGLPPTPEEVVSFLADRSESSVEKVVDRLLASPRFGERWGRHWLDLVRYGETRGHEFDYPIPNAHQYRDYVIRALNEDVAYDQFVLEHIAGDLLADPRRHPVEGFNESILGTGFWFLGEEVHSPVDVRADQADRFDNRIDVMGKTFLGLTVACARCHDHKFDAISQKDYYALYGFLESSSYRQVRFDSRDHNLKLASQIARARASHRPAIGRSLAEALMPQLRRTSDYLLAAREVLEGAPAGKADVVFEDFESGTYDRWQVTGTAFGGKPQTLQTIAPYQGKINAVGRFFVNSYNIRNGEDVAGGDAHKGRMTSRSFTIEHDFVTMLVGGGAHAGKTCVNLLVGGKAVLSSTGRNSNQMFPVRWDVRRWRGKQAKIEIVDDATGGWGNIGVDHIVFTNDSGAGTRPDLNSPALKQRLEAVAGKHKLDAKVLGRWTAHLLQVAQDPSDPLYAWARLAAAPRSAALSEVLKPIVAEGRRRRLTPPDDLEVAFDFGRPRPGQWLADDSLFGVGPVRPGELIVRGPGEAPVISVVDHPGAAAVDPIQDDQRLSPGSANEPGALGAMMRSGRTIRTTSFRLKRDKLYYLVRGGGMAYASIGSHVMIAGPLHARLVKTWPAKPGFHWEEHDLRAYKGQFAHVEFSAGRGSNFAVALVVQADASPAPILPVDAGLLRLAAGAGTEEELAQGYQRLFLQTAKRLADDRIVGAADAQEQARLASWLVRKVELFDLNGPAARAKLKSAVALLTEEARLAARIRRESRLAPAIQDGSAIDERLFHRGSHKTLGPVVGRRFLEALAGTDRIESAGSGRLEMARQMVDQERNPFLARVMVNRLWHHLFGRGIVGSVDNFGVLGSAPSHPELLDYLADQFVKDGWSVKKMIRRIVLTRAYRTSSGRSPEGDRLDPENLLLHRARLRRLEGESIRDALLSISGRLDSRMSGPSVPVYLSEFQQGRGRPASGPLDGAGRRSIYLAVRRNFLSALLLAFDTPSPFSTVGGRTVSNVPAQSLILMNDPFVHQQARLWAGQTLAGRKTDKERIGEMFLAAFSRPATKEEEAACLQFLLAQKGQPIEAWSDLAHSLINVKEFIFLK